LMEQQQQQVQGLVTVNEDEHKNEIMDVEQEQDDRSNDVRDKVDVQNGFHHHEHQRNKEVAEEEEVLRKPTWLQSSYFQKGNFDQKTLHLTWHPKKDVIAAVSGSQLLVFQKL